MLRTSGQLDLAVELRTTRNVHEIRSNARTTFASSPTPYSTASLCGTDAGWSRVPSNVERVPPRAYIY